VKSWAPALAEMGQMVAVGTVGETPPSLVDGVPWVEVTPDDMAATAGRVIGNSWWGPTRGRGGYVHHSVPRRDNPAGGDGLTQEEYAGVCAGLGTQLAVSQFVADAVTDRLGLAASRIPLFAHPAFQVASRPRAIRDVVYASRLSEAKGAALALGLAERMTDISFTFVVNGHEPACLSRLAQLTARSHGRVRSIQARRDPRSVAVTIAGHAVLIMPTPTATEEAFGLLSVEAQHAGVRVVSTRSGGLPETDCGLLTTTDGSLTALSNALRFALTSPAVTETQRERAAAHFTLPESVAALHRMLTAADAAGER
jgi:glycosyltransferase involved in cell wall biosynthesis